MPHAVGPSLKACMRTVNHTLLLCGQADHGQTSQHDQVPQRLDKQASSKQMFPDFSRDTVCVHSLRAGLAGKNLGSVYLRAT